MTVRGFLAWYLGSVTMASALGAVMWHDIHVRRHVDAAAVIAPAMMPAQMATVTDVPPAIAPTDPPLPTPPLPTPPKAGSAGPRAALTPVSPPRTAQSPSHPTRVASNTAKARPVIKTARRVPSYQRPGLPDWEAYPGYASAYPQAVFAPWQMQPYPGYYAYRRYYARYPYYSEY